MDRREFLEAGAGAAAVGAIASANFASTARVAMFDWLQVRHVATVPRGFRAQGITVDPDGERAFVAFGDTGVVVLDLSIP